MCTTTFNPAPTTADAIIAAMSDPALSLADLAARHSTTLEALSLWLTRREISDRLDTLHSLTISRTRYIASTLLSKCINTLATVLDDHAQLRATQVRGTGVHSTSVRGTGVPLVSSSSTSSPSHAPQPPRQATDSTTTDAEAEALRSLGSPPLTTSIPTHQSSSLSPELLVRSAETARRAATRLLQLATFNPPRLFSPLHTPRTQRVALAARPPVMSTELPPQPPPAPPPGPKAPAPAPATPARIAVANSVFSPLPNLASPLPRPSTQHRSPATLLQSAGSSLDLLLSTPHTHWP